MATIVSNNIASEKLVSNGVASKNIDLKKRAINSAKAREEVKITYDLSVYDCPSKERRLVEKFISTKFRESHNAHVTHYLPYILSMYKGGAAKEPTIGSALGLQVGNHDPMYLEQYLERPIEQTISSLTAKPVSRAQICEIGNLAIASKPAGLLMFLLTTTALFDASFKWMTFTATPKVRRLIEGLGYSPTTISPADVALIDGEGAQWGSYYEHNPDVMFVDITEATEHVNSFSALNILVTQHETEKAKLTKALNSIRTTNR